MALREQFVLRGVTLERGGRRILDSVDDHIHAGSTTAILGESGSGKSTFLRLLNRFEDPTSGSITFDGMPLDAHDVHALRRRVGLVAQRPTMLTPTIGEELRVGEPGLTDDAAQALLERVRLPQPLDASTAALSGGEQQRVALARTLATQPEVLLLDEPTSALDDRSAAAVDEVVRTLVRSALTVVLVSHDLGRAAGLADQVLVLHDGRLVERGAPGDVDYLA
jgi:putative ABC transport system ATP-binding protein